MAKQREEVFNVELANLISENGLDAQAETIQKSGKGTELPDVLVDVLGLRVGIEAKFSGAGNAAQAVVEQAKSRLESNLCEVGVALLYPDEIKETGSPKKALRTAALRARFYSPGREGREWHTFGGVREFANALRLAREELVSDDLVTASAHEMRAAIESFVRAVNLQPARREALFGVVTAAGATHATQLDEDTKQAATAISGLVVLTALLLQNEIARFDSVVPPLPDAPKGKRRTELIKSWNRILEHDYEAVFRIATDVLNTLIDSDQIDYALGIARETAAEIGTKGVLGRHDLVGRVYHTLLADKKFLATYYTSIGAAVMLAELALDPDDWADVDFSAAPEDLSLRVGDLACGTGTLLAAAMTTMRANYSFARASNGQKVDAAALSRRMIEDLFYGYDVLAYAVQVCATAMLLGAPATQVSRTRLYQVPFGGEEGYLGSADFLDRSVSELRIFGGQQLLAVTEGEAAAAQETELPELDLVIMNPPFTRSVGGSKLLGSLKGPPFDAARKRLSALVKRPDVRANLTAGLGSVFVELASRCLRPGGRLALVLPKAVLTGESWAESRMILSQDFSVEWVITSHEFNQHNFSDSTQLSEALLVARRRVDGEGPADDAQTVWVNLSENPDNSIEAAATVSALRRIPNGAGPHEIRLDDGSLSSVIGEATRRPAPKSDAPWRYATFLRASLNDLSGDLLEQKPIKLPRVRKKIQIPLVALGEVADIGRDRRDLHDAFELSSKDHGYPAYWGHSAEATRTLSTESNAELVPRSEPAPGRKRILPADDIWAGAGSLMIVERLWLLTHRCTSVVLPSAALSNTWWSIALKDEDWGPFVAMWLNSTLGLIAILGIAEETRGPWIDVKKNKLLALPVLDVGALADSQLKKLKRCWDSVAHLELAPIAKAASDEARKLLDEKIADALGLPLDGIAAARTVFGSEARLDSTAGSLSRERARKKREEDEAIGKIPLF